MPSIVGAAPALMIAVSRALVLRLGLGALILGEFASASRPQSRDERRRKRCALQRVRSSADQLDFTAVSLPTLSIATPAERPPPQSVSGPKLIVSARKRGPFNVKRHRGG
jgi:hypothetical protein